jgi:thiol-disulfide isomerase/thioredoxin
MTRTLRRSFSVFVSVALTLVTTAALAEQPRGVVYDFTASWCGPCQQVAPIVSKLEREGLPIRKVDIDREKELVEKFRIDRVPTFVLVVDGKEVDRTTGPMTEADLRRMIARIPTERPVRVDEALDGQVLVDLGEPGSFPNRGQQNGSENARTSPPLSRPEIDPEPERTQVAENDSRGRLRDLWPFKRDEPEPPTVRGNDAITNESSGSNASPRSRQADPMETSVRIRVIVDGNINLGSGTVVSSDEGITRILTCGHIFRHFNEDSKIEVDLFSNGRSVMHLGRLIKFDLESDVGLISVPTDSPVPVARIAGASNAPQAGEPVASVGCSGGDDPTREQLRVTAVDKYEGPHNIECTGVPVRGRSGGGLFNRSGEVVGVCIAADPQEQRGLYSGLLAVHQLLDESRLSHLYQTPTPAPSGAVAEAALVSAEQEHARSTDDRSSANSEEDELSPRPVAGQPSPAVEAPAPGSRPEQPQRDAKPLDVPTGGAEVVVILRDPSRPEAPQRVVIIHEASPKFLAYLSGELAEGDETPMRFSQSNYRQEPMPSIGATERNDARPDRSRPSGSADHVQEEIPIRSIVRSPRTHSDEGTASSGSSQSSMGKELLSPTTLSQPAASRRYMRSR